MRKPARKLRNDRGQVHYTHRYPHEQAAYLLVFVGSDTPVGLNQVQNAKAINGWLRVNRTYANGRESDENSENAARHAGAEKVEHTARRRKSLLLTRRKNLSPENRA